jgi:superfamily II DNA or RNA helicase
MECYTFRGFFMDERRVPEWFEALSLRAVAGLASVPIDQLLHHVFEHKSPPVLDSTGVLHAVLKHPTRGHVEVTFSPARGGGARFEHVCACKRWGVCEHAAAVLTDLSVSDALRDALVRGMDASALVETLPDARAMVFRAWVAERVASLWVPAETVVMSAPPEFLVVMPVAEEPGTSLQSRVAGFDGMPGIEAKIRVPGQRGFLETSTSRTLSFSVQDRRILRLFDARASGKKSLRATGSNAALALHLLRERGEGRVLLEDGSPLFFAREALSPCITRTRLPRSLLTISLRRDSGTTARAGDKPKANEEVVEALEARWRSNDGAVDIAAMEAVLFRGPYSFLWVSKEKKVFPVDGGTDLEAAWLLQVSPAVEFFPEHAETTWRGLRKGLRGRSIGFPSAATLGIEDLVVSFELHVEGMPLNLTARLEARYHFATVVVTPHSLASASTDDRRDGDMEAMALSAVNASGFRWEASRNVFIATDDNAARFWAMGADGLRSRNDPTVAVLVPASLAGISVREPVVGRLRLSRTGSLLDLALALDAQGRRVDLEAAREALARKKRWVLLDDRSLAEITDAVADLLDDGGDAWKEGDEAIEAQLPIHQLGRAERWIDATGGARDSSARALHESLRALSVAPDCDLPKQFSGTLRPYQRQGLAWMQFLDALGVGGVLADDMGLGKTVMALALIAWKKQQKGHCPSLVVCPTSVAHNWVNECAKFVSDLCVVSLRGMSAETRASADIASADVVITTYALLRRDIQRLRGTAFRYVMLDEAQNIKNIDAATRTAAVALRAELRLALTGTPIENSLSELWSIVDFCSPGILGARKRFEERYERPMVSGATTGADATKVLDASVASVRLRGVIRPFVLRRTRAEVLDDLPPRQEIDMVCPLSAHHRRAYDAMAVVLRDEVREFMKRDPNGKPGIAMFTALLRLRQMACDPRLVDSTTEVVSSKRDVLLSTVRQLVAEGRRALVFSQFVELLKLWRDDLTRAGFASEYLDGSTVDREGAIVRFQRGVAPLFFISLKAGGAGLNLTAADTVIHCDPWWNPAVEEQATARAHRMGQKRSVVVYRLVARGSVEDRVNALKASKRHLADAIVHADHGDTGALAGITADDVFALLANADVDEGESDEL